MIISKHEKPPVKSQAAVVHLRCLEFKLKLWHKINKKLNITNPDSGGKNKKKNKSWIERIIRLQIEKTFHGGKLQILTVESAASFQNY